MLAILGLTSAGLGALCLLDAYSGHYGHPRFRLWFAALHFALAGGLLLASIVTT